MILQCLYFSLIKGYFFVKKTKEDLKENNDESSPNIKKQISNMNQIQNTLFLYPIISCIIIHLFNYIILLSYFTEFIIDALLSRLSPKL